MVYDIAFCSHLIRYSAISISLFVVIEKLYYFFFLNSVFIYDISCYLYKEIR